MSECIIYAFVRKYTWIRTPVCADTHGIEFHGLSNTYIYHNICQYTYTVFTGAPVKTCLYALSYPYLQTHFFQARKCVSFSKLLVFKSVYYLQPEQAFLFLYSCHVHFPCLYHIQRRSKHLHRVVIELNTAAHCNKTEKANGPQIPKILREREI